MSKTDQHLTSAIIAKWIVKYRHTDSDPEMLFRIIRNVDRLVIQEMQTAREDERAKIREVVEKRIERFVDAGNLDDWDRLDELEQLLGELK